MNDITHLLEQRIAAEDAARSLKESLRQRPGYLRTVPKHVPNEKNELNELPPAFEAGLADNSFFSFNSFGAGKRPRLPATALHGPAGEIIRRLEPVTEADPAAMYAQLLVGLGSLIGPGAWFLADGARHHANLFAIICGRTAKARKGTSWARVHHVLAELDDLWLATRVKSGVVSGEGIIEAFREDTDKRLLLIEGEFGQVLQSMKREGNTVSVILRQAWDGARIAVLRRRDPIDVEEAHISLIGHITLPELHRLLASVEISNGLANRCLWIFADREQLLPEGGTLPDLTGPLGQLHSAIALARTRGEIQRDPAARELWASLYTDLSQEPPGQLGEILSRGEAQVMRLALLFALLDHSTVIACPHLEAAMAFWGYCTDSTACIFADAVLNTKSSRILEALESGPMTLRQIHDLFHRNVRKSEIETALNELGPQIEVLPLGVGGGKLVRLR